MSSDARREEQAWDDQKLFGRKQDRPLRARQAGLMEEMLPRVSISSENVAEKIAAHDGPVWLEVGFGGGEHLAWQAQQHPSTLMIGAEPFLNGVAKLLAQMEDEEIGNIAICHGDARPLITAMPDGCLERLFVLHPDPWPKARHAKRRMISQEFLDQAYRLLAPGGVLRIAHDIPGYIRWALMQVQMFNRGGQRFQWDARRADDWRVRPDDWPQTRYEAKAICEGRTPAYLQFQRR